MWNDIQQQLLVWEFFCYNSRSCFSFHRYLRSYKSVETRKVWWEISNVGPRSVCTTHIGFQVGWTFTSLLWHGHAAVCLRDSIIQPIPKGAKDPAKSCNYRGIALASCLGKLLELCILQLFPKSFNSSGRKGALQICVLDCWKLSVHIMCNWG